MQKEEIGLGLDERGRGGAGSWLLAISLPVSIIDSLIEIEDIRNNMLSKLI